VSNETKAIVFIEPISKTMQELYNLLLPDSGSGSEFELYRPSTTLEVSQTLPQLGPSLIITSDHKICALTLAQNKTIIKGLKSKIIIINERKLPAKILDKFHKSGLTDYILEPIALKTLNYKVKLLVKSLPVIGKEKEFGNKLKSGEEKKGANDESSTLVKDKEQKIKNFLERKQLELDQNKERNEKLNELKESRTKEELSKKEEGLIKSKDKEKASSFNFEYSKEPEKKAKEKLELLKRGAAYEEDIVLDDKLETSLDKDKNKDLLQLNRTFESENKSLSTSLIGKNSSADKLTSGLLSESHFQDKQVSTESHASNYKEKELSNLRGNTKGEEAIENSMRGLSSFKEKKIGNLEGAINSNAKESSYLKGKNYYKEKEIEDLKGELETPNLSDEDQKSSEFASDNDLGGHYKGEQKVYRDENLGKAIHKRKRLKKDNEVEIQEEIEIEYIYEEEEVNQPHEGQTDHLGQKMLGKNSTDAIGPGNLVGKGSREKVALAQKNVKKSQAVNNAKTEEKKEKAGEEDNLDIPELHNLIAQLEDEVSEQKNLRLNSAEQLKHKKASKGFIEKVNPMNSHSAKVDHIEKYYGLKTAKEKEANKSTWNLRQGLKQNSTLNANESNEKFIKDKKILQFGQLSEGKGQINYGQIFEEFKDLESAKSEVTPIAERERKSIETLAALINFQEFSRDPRLDSIDLLKKFHFLFNQIYSFELSIQLVTENKRKEIYHSLRGRKIAAEIAQEFQEEKNNIELPGQEKKLNYFEYRQFETLKHKEIVFAYVGIFFYKQAHLPAPEWLSIFWTLRNILLDIKELKGAA
jgi:hypothetical protein